jgi:hypothetical protein
MAEQPWEPKSQSQNEDLSHLNRAGRREAASSGTPVFHSIRALPASRPRTAHRTPATRPHSDTSSETPDEDLPQDPGIPGGPPAPEPERGGGMQDPDSPDDPHGIDAPDSPSEPPPIH